MSGQDATKGSANLATTFFALLLLGVAAGTDDEARAAFAGVQRRKLLRWVTKLQRPDGSFGQVLWEGEAVGGRDTRHSYLASAIRWMLRGEGDEEDIDVERMVDHIRHTQVSFYMTFDMNWELIARRRTMAARQSYRNTSLTVCKDDAFFDSK